MKAMVLQRPRAPLQFETVADPEPGPGQLLIQVEACGVCRTDLHILAKYSKIRWLGPWYGPCSFSASRSSPRPGVFTRSDKQLEPLAF